MRKISVLNEKQAEKREEGAEKWQTKKRHEHNTPTIRRVRTYTTRDTEPGLYMKPERWEKGRRD
jgi:hypothetical protein